tara:strand:+ start:718 stop:1644 length:927 start_codon:yes stop_codon:yes gene_type:complete
MKKIYIIHENDEWLIPLEKELNELKAPYEKWHMNSVIIDTNNIPPLGVFYNRMSASSHTRGHRYAAEFTAIVLDWLEYYQRRVINGSRALSLEVSKSLQYKELKKEGIKIPKTVYAKGKEQLLNLSKNFDRPFITKHNRAGKGLGIKLFDNYQVFENFMKDNKLEDSIDGITLIQEYIKPRNNRIIRVEFINKKFLYAVQVDTTQGFELCPADDCVSEGEFCPANSTGNKFMILEKFSNQILNKYIKVLQNNEIDIAGVEFLEDGQGQLFTYDINTNTNYNSIAENLSKFSGMKTIANFLNAELNKLP